MFSPLSDPDTRCACESVCAVYVTCAGLDGSEKGRIDGQNHIKGPRARDTLKEVGPALSGCPFAERDWTSYSEFLALERPFFGCGVGLAAEWRARRSGRREKS